MNGKTETCGTMENSFFKEFFRFFIKGPRGGAEVVVWVLMLPVTFPILFISQMAIAWMASMVTMCKDSATLWRSEGRYHDYEGGELFDEVSTGRREDVQFLMGTGPYAKENW